MRYDDQVMRRCVIMDPDIAKLQPREAAWFHAMGDVFGHFNDADCAVHGAKLTLSGQAVGSHGSTWSGGCWGFCPPGVWQRTFLNFRSATYLQAIALHETAETLFKTLYNSFETFGASVFSVHRCDRLPHILSCQPRLPRRPGRYGHRERSRLQFNLLIKEAGTVSY